MDCPAALLLPADLRTTTQRLRSRRTVLRALAAGTVALAACGREEKKPAGQATSPAVTGTVAIARATATPVPRTSTAAPTPAPQPLCLVTKERGVPATYVPADLVKLPDSYCARNDVRMRREAGRAMIELIEAAKVDGYELLALSGYRSYDEQVQVLRDEARASGEENAKRQVAPPGHSEHQLGEAMDVVTAAAPFDLETDFGQQPEGRWVARRCMEFGYVLSYPKEKEAVTGYIYEPWHIRYVGKAVAAQVVASGLTLTEFLPRQGLDRCS